MAASNKPKPEKGSKPEPVISARVIVAIACIFTGLLVLVVVVGLLRNQVDTNGLAILLTPIISGLLLGGGLRSARKNGDEGGDDK